MENWLNQLGGNGTGQAVQSFQYWGQLLCALGGASILIAVVLRLIQGGPWATAKNHPDEPPTVAMRLQVHFGLHGVWCLLFGAVIWRGILPGWVDLRTPWERSLGVWQAAEWFYPSAYLIPLIIPWLPRTRFELRRYCLVFLTVLAVSLACFLFLPWYAFPRAFTPTTGIGRLLAWETGRRNFAAASFPSFHVLWALLLAGVLVSFGRGSAWLGAAIVAAMIVACVAGGTHAIADAVGSVVIYLSVLWAWLQADRRLSRSTPNPPTSSPATSPPAP